MELSIKIDEAGTIVNLIELSFYGK